MYSLNCKKFQTRNRGCTYYPVVLTVLNKRKGATSSPILNFCSTFIRYLSLSFIVMNVAMNYICKKKKGTGMWNYFTSGDIILHVNKRTIRNPKGCIGPFWNDANPYCIFLEFNQ